MSNIALWHCHNARSLRPLWALEELGLDYDLHTLPFPPRVLKPEFLEVNVLGTVPFFTDDQVQMTESTAICHYLETRYGDGSYSVSRQSDDYADYLNWLYHSDATLTFPQTIAMRYSFMEPESRRQPQVAEDYSKWFIARLRMLKEHLKGREYLCEEKFTMADIAVGYALFLGGQNGLDERYSPEIQAYLKRLTQRPAFVRSMGLTS